MMISPVSVRKLRNMREILSKSGAASGMTSETLLGAGMLEGWDSTRGAAWICAASALGRVAGAGAAPGIGSGTVVAVSPGGSSGSRTGWAAGEGSGAASATDAVGLLETQGLVAALHATDDMLKSSNVTLVGKEKIGAAYVTVLDRLHRMMTLLGLERRPKPAAQRIEDYIGSAE